MRNRYIKEVISCYISGNHVIYVPYHFEILSTNPRECNCSSTYPPLRGYCSCHSSSSTLQYGLVNRLNFFPQPPSLCSYSPSSCSTYFIRRIVWRKITIFSRQLNRGGSIGQPSPTVLVIFLVPQIENNTFRGNQKIIYTAYITLLNSRYCNIFF